MKSVLITGGAGFIGSHLADELLAHGYHVRALDNLDAQVHGPAASGPPAYLSGEVEFIHGDIRDHNAVRAALRGVEAVVHLAALVGVAQSMYDLARYSDVNNTGTAVLLEALIERPVARLVVASSMTIYGEGMYRDRAGQVRPGAQRSLAQLAVADWELRDEEGRPLTPVPTPETRPPTLPSIYGLHKYQQEIACLRIGQTYDIPTTALRFFNVFGTRQSLSNPYTGVLAIFASRYLNGKPPLITEDGHQTRDFVSVHDAACACRLALETSRAAGEAFNIGCGRAHSVLQISDLLARALGKEDLRPEISGSFRKGDVRHCFADLTKARQILGYEPALSLETAFEPVVEWIKAQREAVPPDRVEHAHAELARRGLTG